VPHVRDAAPTKERSQQSNKNRLHAKHGNIATELLTIVGGLQCNTFLARINALALSYLVPAYPREVFESIPVAPKEATSRSLLVGTDIAEVANAAGTTHLLAHTDQVRARLARLLPECSVLNLLGISTPFERGAFDFVVVTDLIRFLPEPIRRAQISELARIGQRLFVLWTSGRTASEQATHREMGGWEWVSRSAFETSARSCDHTVSVAGHCGDYLILEICQSETPDSPTAGP
jgi:hypothetical protein